MNPLPRIPSGIPSSSAVIATLGRLRNGYDFTAHYRRSASAHWLVVVREYARLDLRLDHWQQGAKPSRLRLRGKFVQASHFLMAHWCSHRLCPVFVQFLSSVCPVFVQYLLARDDPGARKSSRRRASAATTLFRASLTPESPTTPYAPPWVRVSPRPS